MPGPKYIHPRKNDWALCSDHNLPEYRGAHSTEGQAGACRGEGFAAQMEPEENWEAAPVSCVLSNAITAAVMLSQMYLQALWIRKVNGKIIMWGIVKMHIHQTPCLNSVQSAREGTTHAGTGEWMTLGARSHTHQSKTEVTETHIKSGYWTGLVNVPAPCASLHDLTLHAAAQTGAQPELSGAPAAKVLLSLSSSGGRAGPHRAQNSTWLTEGVESTVTFHSSLQATAKLIYQYGNG